MTRVVVILGMDRSGTSLLAQILERMGLWFGAPDDLVPPTSINERGHYEYLPIVRIQDAMLRNLFGVTHLFSGDLPHGWLEWDIVQDVYRPALRDVFTRAIDRQGSFAFKDPRTNYFLPLWQEIFDELPIDPLYVLALRHPEEVYMSIHPWTDALPNPEVAKMHFEQVGIPSLPRANVYKLWADINTQAFRLGKQLAAVVNYGDWFDAQAAKRQADELARALSCDPLSEADIADVIKPDMRRYWAVGKRGKP